MAPLISFFVLGLATVVTAIPGKKPEYTTTVSDVGDHMRKFSCYKTVMPTMGPIEQTRTYGYATTTFTPQCPPDACGTITREMGHGPVIKWVKTVTVDIVTETGACRRTDPWAKDEAFAPPKNAAAEAGHDGWEETDGQ